MTYMDVVARGVEPGEGLCVRVCMSTTFSRGFGLTSRVATVMVSVV